MDTGPARGRQTVGLDDSETTNYNDRKIIFRFFFNRIKWCLLSGRFVVFFRVVSIRDSRLTFVFSIETFERKK